ncbi:MAG: serine hydrolase domain-containing protein [Bacteroidia bacterium]|nr:serine hydrolase domain-containing protein [Bacteroidia bacterium]
MKNRYILYTFISALSTIAIWVGAKSLYLFSCSTPQDISLLSVTDYNEPTSFYIDNNDNDTTIDIIDKNLKTLFRREWLNGGMQIAISKNGKIVYSKGYGYSNVEDSIPMQPYNRMRIASVSKLVTAIAIMHLVDEGKISLDQRVFGFFGILNDEVYLTYRDKRITDITVRQLLNHSGGWTTRWGDPMFMPHSIARQMGKKLPISMHDIIRFMLEKRIHFTPGTASIYCNFGYGVLGEIIEKVTGMPYEEYVKSEILAPLGIYDMQLGYSFKHETLPNEVYYYEADTSACALNYTNNDSIEFVRRAYGGTDIQTLGAAGGWVASATDLLKLTLAIDGFDDVPDILSHESVMEMTHHDIGFDPIGWRTTKGDSIWYRSGTLAATTAMIARHPNNVNYVILMNTGNHRGPELATVVKLVMDRIIPTIELPSEIDLLEDDKYWQDRKTLNREYQ